MRGQQARVASAFAALYQRASEAAIGPGVTKNSGSTNPQGLQPLFERP